MTVEEYNRLSSKLVSFDTKVESPFIIVKIGNYTFGDCQGTENSNRLRQSFKVNFPNFIKNLKV